MDLTPVDGVRRVVAPAVEAAGLYLEDVTVNGQGAARKVTVTVDLPAETVGGVSMDAVAELSRELSDLLDQSDAVAGSYRLEVTTPGVNRPLTEERHFLRARGRLVRLETDRDTFVGRVRGVRCGAVRIASADGDRDVPLAEIRSAKVQVEFSPPPADFEIDLGDAERPRGREGA